MDQEEFQKFWDQYLYDEENRALTSEQLMYQHSDIYPMKEQCVKIDERFIITDIKYPFTSIGLTFYSPSESKGLRKRVWGTGFLIKHNALLTCAHNLYDKQTKSFYYPSQFYPKLSENFSKGYNIKSMYVPQEYKELNNQLQFRNYDYGIAIIEDFQNNLKQLKVLPISTEQIKLQQNVQVYGYPEKFKKTENQWKLCGSKGYINNEDKWKIYHTADTSPGQSGSPIIRQTTNSLEVIGIHTSSSDQNKHGIKINNEVFQQIEFWLNQQRKRQKN